MDDRRRTTAAFDPRSRPLDHHHPLLDQETECGVGIFAGPGAIYTFKHALVFDSLLKSRRQELHRKIACVRSFPNIKTTEPEVLAHHLTEAGLVAAANPLWQATGDRGQGWPSWSSPRTCLRA